MNKALDEVRAGEARRLAQDGYEPVLKRTRWCVLKRKTNLTGKQRFRLRELLRYNLKTARAYLLKEDFQQFWEYQQRRGPASSSTTGASRSCARASSQ
jgi:transposase